MIRVLCAYDKREQLSSHANSRCVFTVSQLTHFFRDKMIGCLSEDLEVSGMKNLQIGTDS